MPHNIKKYVQDKSWKTFVNFPSYSYICSYWKNSLGAQERIRINYGKRAIGGRAVEVLLYIKQRL